VTSQGEGQVYKQQFRCLSRLIGPARKH